MEKISRISRINRINKRKLVVIKPTKISIKKKKKKR